MGLYCPIHANFLSIWKCSNFKKLGGKKLKTFSLFTPNTQFSLHESKLFLGEFSLCVHFRRNKSQYKTLLPALTIPVLWKERRPDHSAGPQGTELSSLCQVWPCHWLEAVGKLTRPSLRLGFCLSNEEVVVRTEFQWKQQAFFECLPGARLGAKPWQLARMRWCGPCCHRLHRAGQCSECSGRGSAGCCGIMWQ